MALPYFDLEVLTPVRKFHAGKAVQAIFTASDGRIAVMRGRSPFVTPVLTCILSVQTEAGWKMACLTAGAAIVAPEKTTILVRSAEWKEEIDLPRARAALARAKERLSGEQMVWEKIRSKYAVARAENRIFLATADASLEKVV
jgi:F-type H+-transporting ATPase subunit epsilon